MMKAEEFKKQLNINLDAILKNVYNHRIGISEAYLLIMEDIKQYADEHGWDEALRYGEHIIKSHIFKKPPLKYDKWKSNQEEQ